MDKQELFIEAVHSHGERGEFVLAVRGEVDMATAPDLDAQIARIEAGQVVVDCSAVEFLDSTGLGVFVRQSQRLAASGGSLRLRRPSEAVRYVLTVTSLGYLVEEGTGAG